eukprot:CAMPEP_0202376764 /NCGR_PEP_ID=MMETSP1127-20130417/7186_1 /ASSEMBLY_ACC=CAM_ASM_000462 /TAXON_ID=3047 /ORGANISM="Dunaliella tertiolecta, Strain CCMP1320" /LENGTH=33 /DNA_ID= /DNA_START= /DNA_END= /DNA_ORIENTATION=
MTIQALGIPYSPMLLAPPILLDHLLLLDPHNLP